MQHQKLAYSVPELSKRTGICERKIWDEITKENLKAGRIGRRVIVTASEAERWLNAASSEPYVPVKTGTALRKKAED